MISHKKFLRRFYLIEKKYYTNKRYDISKNYLHSLIINKVNFFPKFSYLRFFCNLILLILSYISIFLCKFKKISVANYFIVHKKSNGKYDFRSEYVLKNYNFKKSLNIVRCASFIDSLKSYFNYPNVIFFLSIDYFNNPFFYKKSSLRKNYIMLHEKEEKNYNKIININYLSLLNFIEIFISKKDLMDNLKSIIGISSLAGERGKERLNVYSSAKAGFSNYLDGLRQRLFKQNISVVTVKPGFVKTKMTKDLNLNSFLTLSPEKIAKKIYDDFKKNKLTIYPSLIWKFIIFIYKLIPEKIFVKLKT